MLDPKIEKITLADNSHDTREEGMCVMEAVAFLADEPHSDAPQCVCPVIRALLIQCNDAFDSDLRQQLLKPLIRRLIGSRCNEAVEERRRVLIVDWVERVAVPFWLDAAGLHAQSQAFQALPEATTYEQLEDPTRRVLRDDVMRRLEDAVQSIRPERKRQASEICGEDADFEAVRNMVLWLDDDLPPTVRIIARQVGNGLISLAAAVVGGRCNTTGELSTDYSAITAALQPFTRETWKLYPALVERLVAEGVQSNEAKHGAVDS